jgi:hypothetical protein
MAETTHLNQEIDNLNDAIATLERLRGITAGTMGFGLVYDAHIYLCMQRSAMVKNYFAGAAQ